MMDSTRERVAEQAERPSPIFNPHLGWGNDNDPRNDPTYPMRRRTACEIRGYSWERPPQQDVDVEVLTSVERPEISAVFGTSTPPSGLSGMLRRFAFRFGESKNSHWMSLMVADRVNMVEGVLDDLRHGHVPNLLAEHGWGAYWKYDKRRLVRRAALPAALVVGTGTYLAARRFLPRPPLPPEIGCEEDWAMEEPGAPSVEGPYDQAAVADTAVVDAAVVDELTVGGRVVAHDVRPG